MRIDRQRFLLLTASLSGACTSSQPASQAPSEHTAIAPPEPVEPDEAQQPVQPTDREASADAGAASSASASVEVALSAQAAQVTLNSDPKCNDMQGKPGKCQFKAPGPQCESFRDLPNECQLLTKFLKPKVAERAVDCIAKKSGTPDICEFALPSRCATEAIRNGVCPDKAAEKNCASLVANCSSKRGSLSLEECKAGYSAVTPKSQKKMLSCMSEFCTIEHCLYQL
jgi:hypothetical protein